MWLRICEVKGPREQCFSTCKLGVFQNADSNAVLLGGAQDPFSTRLAREARLLLCPPLLGSKAGSSAELGQSARHEAPGPWNGMGRRGRMNGGVREQPKQRWGVEKGKDRFQKTNSISLAFNRYPQNVFWYRYLFSPLRQIRHHCEHLWLSEEGFRPTPFPHRQPWHISGWQVVLGTIPPTRHTVLGESSTPPWGCRGLGWDSTRWWGVRSPWKKDSALVQEAAVAPRRWRKWVTHDHG